MILYDSTDAEIYLAMKEELPKVAYYVSKEEKNAFKCFRDAKKFPALYHKMYTVPSSMNKYLVWYYAMTFDEYKSATYYYGNALIINDHKHPDKWKAVACRRQRLPDKKPVESLQIYTGHFFSRYRERVLLDGFPKVNDVVTTFFGRNVAFQYRLEFEKLNINYEKYHFKNGAAWRIDDGVTLGEEEWITVNGKDVHVVKHNTFLSQSILKDGQKDYVPSRKETRQTIMSTVLDRSDLYI